MDKDDAQFAFLQVPVKRNSSSEEIVYTRDCLHTGKAAAGHNDRHQRTSGRGALEVRFLKIPDHAVSQIDGIAQRLHRQSVLRQSRKVVVVGDITHTQDEVIVG